MKRVIKCAKKPNKFSYTNHRKGIVTFDTMETFEQKYKYNGLSNKMCRLNFIFDTAAHINYAAYLNSNDWSDADVAEMIDSCIDIKDLLASWDAAAVAHLKDVPSDCVGCYINLEVFGVGDKSVTITTSVSGEQHGTRGNATFDYSNITTILDRYFSTSPEVYQTTTVTPNKMKLMIRAIVKYLTSGL